MIETMNHSWLKKTLFQKDFEHIVTAFCLLDLHCFCRSIAYIEFHTESFSFFPIFHYLIHNYEVFLKFMIYNMYLTSHFYDFNAKNVFCGQIFFFILNSNKSIWLDLNKVNCFPFVTFLTKIRKNQGNIFSNFSCMFLNPNNFFQFEF